MGLVRLGAYCELESETGQQLSFCVSEFAVLCDGSEIALHSERGFSMAAHQPSGLWAHLTVQSLERDVRIVVLPDDAEQSGEDHPWEWLVTLLVAHGVSTTVEQLRHLPYEVRIESVLRERLESGLRS